MNSLVLALIMQVASPTTFIVSTKAGLVNYVQGSANVKPATSVGEGKVISTGPGGAVEILLNPGSYLRMGENTRAVLDKVDLYDIAIRILEGSAVIEATGFDRKLPLTVTAGNLMMEIIKDGIYLFADGKVVIVDGRVRDASNGLVYGKGYQISDDQGYRAQKVKTFTTSLELWSQKRDEEIARANLNIARSLRKTQDVALSSLLDVWLWSPAFGCFIYMPGGRYRSPYGYVYQPVINGYYPGYGVAGGGGGGSNSTASAGSSGGSGAGSSTGVTGGGGGGYFGGGGGIGPAVAPAIQAPSSSSGTHSAGGTGRPNAQ